MDHNLIIKEEREDDVDSEENFRNELKREIQEAEAEEEKEKEIHIQNYQNIQDIIKSMCADMQNKNPNIHNQLGNLIHKLEEQSNIVKKGIKGGGKKIGVRLSALSDSDKLKFPSNQAKFTKKDIEERLAKFSRVSLDDLYDMPKGIWLRYFIHDPDKKGAIKYRTGGFIIHKDPERRYITMISHHGSGSSTWSVQTQTAHSYYVHTKNYETFKRKQQDNKYKLFEGTSTMLDKWFTIKTNMLTKMQIDNKNVVYIVYDKSNNKLYAPTKRQTNKKLLELLDIEDKDFKTQLLKGIVKQLQNPIHGVYIIGIIDREDLPKVKKMRSRIKGPKK